jgi:hypothetical protein
MPVQASSGTEFDFQNWALRSRDNCKDFYLIIAHFFRWFCHFDDDNYVNVPGLVKKLQDFDYRQDWYLGKPSIPEPLEILDRDNMQVIKKTSLG